MTANLIRSHHFLSPATLISDNSAVSVLTSILKQPVPSLPLLSTLNLTTVTLSTTIFLNLKSTASSRFRTVLHVLWLKLLNLLLSHLSSDLCTGSRSTNALNISSFHLPTKFSQPANLTTYTILSLFSLQVEPAPHSVVTLARPSVSSSLQITNRSFRYASPHRWNQLPSSFRQPRCVHAPPGSPHPTYITSSQSSPSFSPSVTPSTFHSRLKTHLFHKSFPP